MDTGITEQEVIVYKEADEVLFYKTKFAAASDLALYKMKKASVLILISAILLCGCKDHAGRIYRNWNKGRADSFGKYIDANENLMLDVYNENGFLRYRLITGKDTILKSNENASVYQKWLLFLDDQKNLWVESSDIGTWVWVKDSSNKYSKFNINNRPEYIAIPRQFINSLSDIHRK